VGPLPGKMAARAHRFWPGRWRAASSGPRNHTHHAWTAAHHTGPTPGRERAWVVSRNPLQPPLGPRRQEADGDVGLSVLKGTLRRFSDDVTRLGTHVAREVDGFTLRPTNRNRRRRSARSPSTSWRSVRHTPHAAWGRESTRRQPGRARRQGGRHKLRRRQWRRS